jgi:hypothetical protein
MSQSNTIPKQSEWVTSPSHSLLTERDKTIYNMGKIKGAEEHEKELIDLIQSNFKKSYLDTSKVLKEMLTKKINVISARLKVESIHSLKVALAVSPDDNLKENIGGLYNFIFELEGKTNSSKYNIDFSIIKATQELTDKCIENDGYIYKHLLLTNAKRSRRSQSKASK